MSGSAVERGGALAGPRMTPRRAITAAGIGNVLEYYDFGVYGFLAPAMARRFFPAAGDRAPACWTSPRSPRPTRS